MFRSFFLIAWRNLQRNLGYSFINIFGLAAGLAVALTIGLWVYHEYSFDKFLPGHEQVYQVRRNFDNNGEILNFTTVALKLADALRGVPEIDKVVAASWIGPKGLMVGNKKLIFKGPAADDGFFDLFQHEFIKGSGAAALKDPYSIVITESVAKAFFGDADPINQTIRYENLHDLKVTGLIRNLPSNTTLQFDFVIPMAYLDATQERMKRMRERFSQNAWQEFVKLKPGISLAQVAPKISKITRTEQGDNAQKSTVILQPVARWHLYNKYINGKDIAGNIDYIRMFSIIAILVLLIACINFINLSTARSEKRAREVGVRKAIGSLRSDLILQFLMESLLLTLTSFILALMFVQIGLPFFNQLTGRSVVLPWGSAGFWLMMIALILFTAIAAGGRPALFLSAFQPVKVLKGNTKSGRSASISRKLLVVIQFTCSIALIISTIIIYQQIKYVKDRPTGFDRDRLLMTNMQGDLEKNYIALRNELKQKAVISSMTTATSPATNVGWHSDVDQWPGKIPGETIEMGTVFVSEDYFETMGIGFKEGHGFSSQNDTNKVIFNEAAVQRMRMTNPIGQLITWSDTKLEIIGVANNALLSSPFDVPEPMMFMTEPGSQGNIIYKLDPKIGTAKAVEILTATFNRFNPSFPYAFEFADSSYAQKFNLEVMIGKLAALFAILAILISCLGLFGLAAFTAEQRNKEIGIRKVLGASVAQVWMLLSKDFVVLVLLSILIAVPLAWYYLQNWLNGYDYRITIGADVFFLAGLLAMIITLLTISFQSIRAALANPVSSLKDE